MKKLKCLAAASLVLSTIGTNAKPVPQTTAATVAANYYTQMYNSTGQAVALTHTEYSSDGQAVYYAFNVGANNGFVIVSAEDAGRPLIGISDVGQYVTHPANSSVAFWMNLYKDQVVSMRTSSTQASAAVTAEWNSYINYLSSSRTMRLDGWDLRIIRDATSPMPVMSTGSSALSNSSMSRVRLAMPIAWSPIRSRSLLILITERINRRSTAMGCSCASSS